MSLESLKGFKAEQNMRHVEIVNSFYGICFFKKFREENLKNHLIITRKVFKKYAKIMFLPKKKTWENLLNFSKSINTTPPSGDTRDRWFLFFTDCHLLLFHKKLPLIGLFASNCYV